MKKHLLFAILLFGFGFSLNAQLASGTVFTGNITGDDVVTGEKVDVQAWLADGKAVVIDVFATWCGPCWGFHATGWLDDMNERFGPEGTDQVRILGLEADPSTSVASIMTNQFGEPGSWVVNPETLEPITYNLVDVPSAINTLSINYFPTLYIIRPDGTLVEIANYRYNEEYWLAAMGIEDGPNAFLTGSLPNDNFCESVVMSERDIEFENVGDAPITSASFNVYGNGEILETVTYSGSEVGIFQKGTIQISEQTFSETTEVSIGVAEINGDTDVESMISSQVVKPEIMTEMFTFQFTTDYYALESSWVIQDDQGNVIASDTYEGGPDQFGGGGPDANITHEYQLETTADINCLTVLVSDSYGDGMIYWSEAEQIEPGWGIIDSDGNVVKESAEGRFTFTSIEGNVASSVGTSSLPELTNLESAKVFPNPVSTDLNLALNFNQTQNFTIDIVNGFGQKVMNLGNFNSNQFNRNIDINHLPAGMYMINIRTQEAQKTLKFNKI